MTAKPKTGSKVKTNKEESKVSNTSNLDRFIYKPTPLVDK